MKEPNDDFFEGIRKALLHHEEPYQEGAWERFANTSAPTPKKLIYSWIWPAAAAILIGIIVLGYFYFKPAIKNETVKNNFSETPIKKSSYPKKSIDTIYNHEEHVATISSKNSLQRVRVSKKEWAKLSIALQQPVIPINNQPIVGRPLSIAPEKPSIQEDKKPFWENRIITEKAITDQPRQNNNIDRSVVINYSVPDIKPKAPIKKWQSSVYVSPIMGDLGINMGYGYSIGYAINDKVRISSGISHAIISASRSEKNNTTMVMATNSSLAAKSFATAPSQQLESVESSLSGIDVPVELTYNFNKKIYAAGGVSGLFVLKDKKSMTTVTSQTDRVTVTSSNGKVVEDKNITFNSVSNASSNDFIKDQTTFLGYYNMSVGFKQKISSKNSIAVEPFIKVPMKNVTNQNLNYLGAGIKFKVDF